MILDVLQIEKSLLAGEWDSHIPESTSANLAQTVVNGSFREALTSPFAQAVFKVHSLEQPFDAALSLSTSLPDETETEILRLTLAVACLHAFVQENWTGPRLDVNTLDVIILPSEELVSVTEGILNAKAISELAYGGEPAYHLSACATFLRLAQLLLELPYRHCQSVPWWRMRTSLVHQQVLDEPVAPPTSILASVEDLISTMNLDPSYSGRLILEEGLLEHQLAQDKSAAEYFVRAARATGLEYELTGAMGKRTKFQQDDLSQLVLLAESHLQIEPDLESKEGSRKSPNVPVARIPETLALNDDTLLEQTVFTSSTPNAPKFHLSHLDPASQPPLHPLDQCILLSLCLNVKNTSPSHGLTNEQMTPYVSRVISHPRNWSVHTMALLLRSRLESSRTRTVERSTLQLQALVDQMPTADSELKERLLYFHSIPLPSKWKMEKELAMQFLSLGAVKSALEIFERLEMWEEVVKCWQSMERTDKAVAIVRDLLEGRREESETVLLRGKATTSARRSSLDSAREAKLWCLLGDLEPEKAVDHYKRAWAISKETSGRAMRSLGGYYFARGNYAKAITSLKNAVAINPILARSWFILGCAYVREEVWDGAREAFSRCVAIDDEDGESWNNLASMYLRMGDTGKQLGKDDEVSEGDKSVPYSNKMLAFRALKQGLRFSYDNWRMWNNYMIVAMDVGELSEACRALARVVEETSSKVGAQAVDEDVLERLVDAVTRASPDQDDAGDGTAENVDRNPNEGHGLLKRVLDLFERTILPRVSSTRIFRAYARLLTWQSRWEEVLKAYLDGYRCSMAGTMETGETEVEKWRQAVGEVEDIVDVLRNFGPRMEQEGGSKWLLQAKSIVRTFIGRTRDFEDEPEWARLMVLIEELRKEE